MYYLVTERGQDAICLVKATHKQMFLRQWSGKIVFSAHTLSDLLPRIHLQQNHYCFSDN